MYGMEISWNQQQETQLPFSGVYKKYHHNTSQTISNQTDSWIKSKSKSKTRTQTKTRGKPVPFIPVCMLEELGNELNESTKYFTHQNFKSFLNFS